MNLLRVMVSFVASLVLIATVLSMSGCSAYSTPLSKMPTEYQQGYEVGVKYAKETGFASDVLFAHGTIRGKTVGYAMGFCSGFVRTMKKHNPHWDYDCICGFH